MSTKLHIYFALDHDEAKSLELCDSMWCENPSPKHCFSMEYLYPVCIPWVPPAPGKVEELLGHTRSYREHPPRCCGGREGLLPSLGGKHSDWETLQGAGTL